MHTQFSRTMAASILAFALGSGTALASNCQGRRETGAAVGAIGGALVGNMVSHNTGGTLAGAAIGGLGGMAVNGANCRHYDRKYYRHAYSGRHPHDARWRREHDRWHRQHGWYDHSGHWHHDH